MTPIDRSSARVPEPGAPRTGYVALVGRPNAGKSTLLNALVGEKLSIVTPKPQTTWQRVTGIATTGDVQMIFLDTPGLLEPKDLLQRSMLDQALHALGEADVVLVVLDATQSLDPTSLESALRSSRAPRLVAVNKVDAAQPEAVRAQLRWAEETLGARAFPISALRGTGVPALTDAIAGALPAAPFLYPPDEIASEPVRFFVAELVRETVFERYRQEIPYSVFCRVEEFREDQEPTYIEVGVFVERESQKGILVGKGGVGVRELGRISREKIEHFLGRAVYLELWVKTLPDWRRKRGDLVRFGFRVPEES
jgi:GTP-binding protein Era